MSDLYDGCNTCRDLADVESGFIFNLNVIETALKRIYETDFNPMTDIEENLFRETWKTFNHAVDKGVGLSTFNPEADFIEALKTNNAVFSAFRTHRMQNDIAAQLLDEKGKLKPFNQFVKDTSTITDDHVNQWLRTEYDTAVIRAHNAADWKQFESEKDVLPNLEWMPTTSVIVGEDHHPFWGVVYPVNATFWNAHKPGDRWNCKCRLQATDKTTKVAPKEGKDLKYAPAAGLDNNPAKDGMLFSFGHPFFTVGYMAYKKLAPIVDTFIDKQLTKAAVANLKKVRATLPLHNGLKIAGEEFVSGKMIILRRSLDDVFEHNQHDKWMKTWLVGFDPQKSIKKWKYEGWAHPKKDKNGVTKHPEATHFNYYSFKINGKTYWANVKAHKLMKGEVLYTIEKNKPIDLIEGKKK
jgi:hypothetical protein